ncbi:MAG: methionyl-tRNA formyltransferase [Pseudomonadota bacterium]|nr:methionyl-tRNA formyltransferase [Pseudomonadota bacterium]
MVAALRVGFAGTPPFAATALAAILDAGCEVGAVLTRPDRPRGRGLKLTPSAVKLLALQHGLTLLQPATLNDRLAQAALVSAALDVLVVAAYGLILPEAVLDGPRLGCINIHASLLPRWRGAAPIQRALLEGDTQTGISIMRMDSGLDTGALISSHAVAIEGRESAAMLTDRLAAMGAEAIVRTLANLQRAGRIDAFPQDEAGATYARKISRDDAVIDWRHAAPAIDRQVRALNPVPGAVTTLDEKPLKIWVSEPAPGRFGASGTVVRADSGGLVIACGDGALIVRELQRAGGKRLGAAEFLAGNPIGPGRHLGEDSPI